MQQLQIDFGLRQNDEFSELPRDIYPDRLAAVIRLGADRSWQIDLMRWGFPPPPRVGNRPVTNVRNLDSPYWRRWLAPEHRCLVPFSVFAEPWPRGRTRDAWFGLADGRAGAFAGIWCEWTGTRGLKSAPVTGKHLLFAFLTCAPNQVVAPIHPKAMPVILATRAQQEAWLSAPAAAVPALAEPLPADQLVQVDEPPEDEAA